MSDNDLKKLKEENDLLNRSLEAYDKIFRLNEKEIINLEEMVEMYDRITNFNREEMIFKEKIQHALESVIESSRGELIDRTKITEAFGVALDMSRGKLADAKVDTNFNFDHKLRNTIDDIFENHRKELINKDEMFKAIETTLGLSREELMESHNRLKKLEQENKKLKEEREKLS